MKARIPHSVVLFLCLISLQGCLVDRLEGSRKQICEEKIHITSDGGVSVQFDVPTFYREDIVKIIGSEPDEQRETESALWMKYVVGRKGDDNRAHDLPLVFHFKMTDDDFRLSRVDAHKNLTEVLSWELIDKVFQSVCTTQMKDRAIHVDISDVDTGKLPSEQEVEALLGVADSIEGSAKTYLFGSASETAEIKVDYGENRDRVSRVEVAYFRFLLKADFESGQAMGKLRSFGDAVDLGLWAMFSR